MDNLAAKDPDGIERYFIVWCSKDGTNDGSADDTGELQGATISTSTWTVPAGITKDADGKDAVTIRGIAYPINTVAQILLSGGDVNTDYELTNEITTSDGRTLNQSIKIRVREQ